MFETGKLKINGSLVLAPMAGYTDSPFRQVAGRYGAAMLFTELISADGIIRGNIKTNDLLRFTEQERPIGIQIFGSDPHIMSEAAKRVEELKPDFIDINAGCSVRRVLRGGSGAALLSDPELLGRIVAKVVKSVSVPVSAKIRTGPDASNKNYAEITHILHDSGISFISVHGRTRAQGFKGEVDWRIIKEIKDMSRVPVLGNGDIKSHTEALQRLEFSGCDAVMIGRGAIGNPWIFTDHVPGKEEIAEQIKEHLELMLDHYGVNGIVLFRKHIVKYIRGMKNSAELRAVLLSAKTKEEILNLLGRYLTGKPNSGETR